MKITPEMIAALDALRAFRFGLPTDKQVADAIYVLDNADVFAPIDDAREEGEGLEPGSQNDVRADFINVYARTQNIQRDYAEGLMRHIEDMARHQSAGDAMLTDLLDKARIVRGDTKGEMT